MSCEPRRQGPWELQARWPDGRLTLYYYQTFGRMSRRAASLLQLPERQRPRLEAVSLSTSWLFRIRRTS